MNSSQEEEEERLLTSHNNRNHSENFARYIGAEVCTIIIKLGTIYLSKDFHVHPKRVWYDSIPTIPSYE